MFQFLQLVHDFWEIINQNKNIMFELNKILKSKRIYKSQIFNKSILIKPKKSSYSCANKARLSILVAVKDNISNIDLWFFIFIDTVELYFICSSRSQVTEGVRSLSEILNNKISINIQDVGKDQWKMHLNQPTNQTILDTYEYLYICLLLYMTCVHVPVIDKWKKYWLMWQLAWISTKLRILICWSNKI